MTHQSDSNGGELSSLIATYGTQIDTLSNDVSKSQILEMLLTRDRLARALEAKPGPDADSVEKAARHDQRLKKQAGRIGERVGKAGLHAWRQTLKPAAGAWWWYLDEQAGSGGLLTWLRGLLNVRTGVVLLTWAALTIAAALMTEVARRGLAGNPDWLTAGLALLQGGLALFAANRLLARPTQTPADLGQGRWHELTPGAGRRFVMALGLAVVVGLVLWLGLPQLSVFYSTRGHQAFDFASLAVSDGSGPAGRYEPVQAIEDLQRAVSLDPNNVDAHYRLGLLYDFLLDTDKAASSYRAAMAGPRGSAVFAPINIAGPLLDAEKYARALDVLHAAPPRSGHQDRESYAYLWHRQRGWALLGLLLYEEAGRALTVALQAAPAARLESGNQSLGRDAHCLLAQLHEKRASIIGSAERSAVVTTVPWEALDEWEQCLIVVQSADSNVEEHYPLKWYYQACERLRAASRRPAQCTTD